MTHNNSDGVAVVTTPPTPAQVDDRYGRSRQRGIDRRFGWIAAGALLVLGVFYLFFSGWQQGTNIEFSDLRYEVRSATEVNLGFEVSSPANAPVACALEALSTTFSTVGWKIVELPVSELRHRTFSENIATTYPGTTATVRSCWIVTQP